MYVLNLSIIYTIILKLFFYLYSLNLIVSYTYLKKKIIK